MLTALCAHRGCSYFILSTFHVLHEINFKLQFSSILSITVYQMHSAKAAVRTRFSNDKLS